jgi:hypothetical protein
LILIAIEFSIGDFGFAFPAEPFNDACRSRFAMEKRRLRKEGGDEYQPSVAAHGR